MAQLGVLATDIAIVIALIYFGRVLFQYPLGALSDRVDRRTVILVTSAIASCVLLAMAILADPDYTAEKFDLLTVGSLIFAITMILLGGSLLTLYSILVAHALDRTVPVFVSSTAVTMLFVWTIGSILGPLLAGLVTGLLGDGALNWMNFVFFLGFTIYLAQRIR